MLLGALANRKAMAEVKCGLCTVVSGACICTCSRPHLPLCSLCVLTHISTPGSHIIQPLPQASPSEVRHRAGFTPTPANEFCSVCTSGMAESVCCCESTGIVLCGKCISTHTNKTISKVHIILPLKARAFIGRPGYVDRLRERQNSLEQTVNELNRSISRVESCQASMYRRVEDYVQTITRYRDSKAEELSRYKAFLQASIQKVSSEVLEHIYDEDHAPGSPLAAAVWQISFPKSLEIFKFQEKGQYEIELTMGLNSDMRFTQSNNIPCSETQATDQPKTPVVPHQPTPATPNPRTPARSGKTSPKGRYDPSSTLVHVSDGRIGLYNCFTQKFTPITDTPALASVMSSTMLLPTGTIFLTGKEHPVSATALEVDTATGKLTRLLDMQSKRFGHGVAFDGSSVYVFGGTGAKQLIKKCEAFGLESRQWRKLADMAAARDFFNPCLCAEFIYIFGGRGTNSCEKYSIAANIFTPLSIKVPVDGHCSSVLSGNSIVIIQSKHIARWRIDAAQVDRGWKEGPAGTCWGNTNPVLVNRTAFIVISYQGKVSQIKVPK